MARCLIGLGSNLGDRSQTLDRAVEALAAHAQIGVVERSRWRSTIPIGGPPGQREFLNGAVLVETELSPQQLLGVLIDLEHAAGRRRAERWDARTLDLDLLLYDDAVIETPRLTVPHPAIAYRRFVLEPAAEIAGAMRHPTTGWTVRQLLEHLNTAAAYVAVTGTPASGSKRLATALAKRHAMRLIVDPAPGCVLVQPAADPTGPGLQAGIELVEQRRKALAVVGSGPAAEPTVSDFWFDDCLAHCATGVSGDAWPALEEAWNKARGAVPRPKLLIVVAHWLSDGPAAAPDREHDTPDDRREAQFESAIAALARGPTIGPVARIERTNSFERQEAEASAAIEAMK